MLGGEQLEQLQESLLRYERHKEIMEEIDDFMKKYKIETTPHS